MAEVDIAELQVVTLRKNAACVNILTGRVGAVEKGSQIWLDRYADDDNIFSFGVFPTKLKVRVLIVRARLYEYVTPFRDEGGFVFLGCGCGHCKEGT